MVGPVALLDRLADLLKRVLGLVAHQGPGKLHPLAGDGRQSPAAIGCFDSLT